MQQCLNDSLAKGGLVPVASGKGHDGAISIQREDAVLWVVRLADGETVELPSSVSSHLFVARVVPLLRWRAIWGQATQYV
jgi:hypothetical protein